MIILPPNILGKTTGTVKNGHSLGYANSAYPLSHLELLTI